MLAEMIFGGIIAAYLSGVVITTAVIKYRKGDEPFESITIPEMDNFGNFHDVEIHGPAYKRIWSWPLLIVTLPLSLIGLVQKLVPSRLERSRRELLRRVPKDYDIRK